MRDILKGYLPEFLFAGLFAISYLPHFLYTWIPLLLNDSYAYLLLSYDFCHGEIPLRGHAFDLPLGLPLILSGVMMLGGSLKHFVLLQTIFQMLAFLYLVRTVKSISYLSGFLFALLAYLYVSNSDSMLWNTLIYTESIYISCLVLIASFLLKYLHSGRSVFIYAIMVMVLGAALLRSNGIYLFFLPIMLVVRSLFQGNQHWKHSVVGCIMVISVSVAINWSFKGNATPFEFGRATAIIGGDKKDGPSESLSSDSYANTFGSAAWKLLTNGANTEMGNHYYFRVHNRITQLHPDSLIAHIKLRGHIYPQYKIEPSPSPVSLVSFLLAGITLEPDDMEKMYRLTDIDVRPRNPWLYLNHLIHLSRPLARNALVVSVFYILVLWSLMRLRDLGTFFGTIPDLILSISLIHIVSLLLLMLLVPRDTSLSRYAIVSEFIPYLAISLAVPHFVRRWSGTPHTS